jgi:hypothetical protein
MEPPDSLSPKNYHDMKLLQITHTLWSSLVKPGDTVIDATLGNGKDTLFLAKLLQGKGILHAYDIQESALKKSAELLQRELSYEEITPVHLHLASHESFEGNDVALVVYNLGYLPGGDKSITTTAETTLKSLKSAEALVKTGGAISLTCYVGHEEGKREHDRLMQYARTLSPEWISLHFRIENRKDAPELLLFIKERNSP